MTEKIWAANYLGCTLNRVDRLNSINAIFFILG